MTQAVKQTLRFGIMCSGTDFQAWQADTITALLGNPKVTCELLIFHKKGQVKRKEKPQNFLWSKYFEFTKNQSKVLKSTSLSSTLEEVPQLDCKIIRKGKFSEYFYDADIEQIREYNLDFILKLSRGIIRGDILETAKYGVWSFHHGDEMKYRGRPACFWEIYNDDPVTGAILQRITNKLDAGTVLKKEFFETQNSYVKNRDQVYLKSSGWPNQVCLDILKGNADYFQKEPSMTQAQLYYLPTNLEFLYFLWKAGLKRIQQEFIINSPEND